MTGYVTLVMACVSIMAWVWSLVSTNEFAVFSFLNTRRSLRSGNGRLQFVESGNWFYFEENILFDFPYLLVVLTFALLSAYLLLSKPRVAKRQTPIEPDRA